MANQIAGSKLGDVIDALVEARTTFRLLHLLIEADGGDDGQAKEQAQPAAEPVRATDPGKGKITYVGLQGIPADKAIGAPIGIESRNPDGTPYVGYPGSPGTPTSQSRYPDRGSYDFDAE